MVNFAKNARIADKQFESMHQQRADSLETGLKRVCGVYSNAPIDPMGVMKKRK